MTCAGVKGPSPTPTNLIQTYISPAQGGLMTVAVTGLKTLAIHMNQFLRLQD